MENRMPIPLQQDLTKETNSSQIALWEFRIYTHCEEGDKRERKTTALSPITSNQSISVVSQ